MGDVNPINFKKAYDYISKTSSEDIFKRVAIYSAWAGFKYKKNFGHDIIVTLAAAFCGPFDGFNKDPYENIALRIYCPLLIGTGAIHGIQIYHNGLRNTVRPMKILCTLII